jgi:hypothetical protein
VSSIILLLNNKKIYLYLLTSLKMLNIVLILEKSILTMLTILLIRLNSLIIILNIYYKIILTF